MPASFNGAMGAKGYGWHLIAVERLDYGVEIVSSRDQARNTQAFYGITVEEGSFSMSVMMSSWTEYEAFSKWLRNYGLALSAGKTGPMRVIVPTRNIDRVGVLNGGITFGKDVQTKLFRMRLSFIGSREPITSPDSSKLVSSFAMPTEDHVNAPFFYPGGLQLAGQLSADDFFGPADDQNAPPDLPPPPATGRGTTRQF